MVASLDRVCVEIAGTRVLGGLDLTLRAGEVVGVTGRNGTGKTTLLGVLATLRRPTAGSMWLFGMDVSSRRAVSAELRLRLCLVGHEAALHPHRTVGEELELVRAVRGWARMDIPAALAAVGMAGAAGRRVAACSQGMRRRADLARAWLGAPDLLLLDEPDAGLDADAALAVEGLIADVRARQGATVLVGHDRDRLDRLCDRVTSLSGGRLVEVAP